MNIEEPTVVTASAPAERAKLLPALPASVSPASPELACGYDLVDGVAQKLDRVAVPAVCTGLSDERALRGSVAHRSLAAAHLLTKVLERDDRERSITRALLALLIEVPLAQVIELARTGTGCDDKAYPEACAAQRALIDQQLGASFHATLYALHVCSGDATPDPGYAPWRSLCQTRLAAAEATLKADARLEQLLAGFRTKAKLAAAGKLPEGPEACWQPYVPALSPETQTACAAAELPPSAAPWQPAPSLEEEYAGPWPRDHRYGPLDAATKVRVSVAALEAPTVPGKAAPQLDARGFTSAALHGALAACLAADTGADKQKTVALQVGVELDAKARVKKVSVKPQTADALQPSAAMSRCVEQAFKALPVFCAGSRAKAQLNVCMRHESDAVPVPAAAPSQAQ